MSRVERAGRLARAFVSLLSAVLLHAGALAHDSGVSNGVFRSRDGGATWLQVNPESFARGALALAVHPADPHHLLLATDSGLLRSRNGGRDWEGVAPDVISGPMFAVAFDVDGSDALASGATALYRNEGPRWRATRTPVGAAPARALVPGGVPGRIYLAGWTGLYRSDNAGRSWTRVAKEIDAAAVRSVVVSPQRADEVHALAAGRVWASTDGARHWRIDDGAPAQADALAFDRTVPHRLWVVAAGRAYRSDDRAARWDAVGVPIPDAQATASAIHVLGDAMLVATDRGVFRSADAGATWTLLSAELPNHSEGALLLRDPHDAQTVYAGFSRMAAEQLKGAGAVQGQAAAGQDMALFIAIYAAFGLLLLGIGIAVRRMTRLHAESSP